MNTTSSGRQELATFGGGCFWCIEAVLQRIEGVLSVTSGYSGGSEPEPTYEDVCTDETGHAEVVQINYDPKKIKYEQLLDVFWSIHYSTQLNRQGPDTGTQYRSVIFYHNEQQKKLAEESKKKLKYKKPVVTEIVKAKEFYKAEEYHQRYLQKKGLTSCRL